MAYNLQSLITILEQILNPKQTHWILDHNKPQLESLLEKAVSLQQIHEKSPLIKIGSLESQIRDAAHKGEDIIESHMVDQMLSSPGGVSCIFSTPNLQQVIDELDSAMVKLVEGKTTSSGSSSSGALFSGNVDSVQSKAVVGVDADLRRLTDRLLGMQSKLEIVPFVGMGGIGKTTLALKLYQDQSVVEHFTCLAWTTVSRDYNIKTILLSLLRCIIGKECDQHIDKESHELKDILYRRLYGRRYMIVLDDVWNIKLWDEIRSYFPDNNKGSQIVITTRESEVAKHANSQSLHHQMKLLDESESWNLLRQIVFGQEGCPDSIQGIGVKIARDCGGLPLAINVIGGILSKVRRSKDVWENIAIDVRAAIAEADVHFYQILSLSYIHLPNYLKPCFLYMGAIPEDCEIKTSKLIRLWVAEGFVKSNGDKSLEEEAKQYLNALVERNLLLISSYKGNGKPKRCMIHDLLRDLCMRKAYEDKFLYVKNSPNLIFSLVDQEQKSNRQFSDSRRVSVHASCGREDVYASPKLISLTRSFLSTKNEMILSSFFCALRLVRVLDVMDVEFQEFPTEILQLVNLRFLAFCCASDIPRGISRLWNLQTLIAKTSCDIPNEILELSELRHLKLVNAMVCFGGKHAKRIVCKKLLTISLVFLTRSLIRRGFFKSIPDIKDLGIYYYDDNFQSSAYDLTHLHKLETLRCELVDSRDTDGSRRFWSTVKFPIALRQLTLASVAIFSRVSTLLCTLPNLEVLKIDNCGFNRKDDEDEEWEVAEGDEFHSLQFLSLANLWLKRWRADETNFPRLRHLRLSECYELEEIPNGIGEIPTLQLIELDHCSYSAEASARQIVEEQQSEYGNYDLKLSTSFY